MSTDTVAAESLEAKSTPLVSVIVPTYEDDEYVDGALESVFEQTYDEVEVVIVDSSDVTRLKAMAAASDRIRYVYQEPRGLAAARNRGLDVATGDIVTFLDADDRWKPEKLEKQVEFIRNGADVVYSDVEVLGAGGRRRLSALDVESRERHYIDFLYEGGVPILTVAARRECFERIRFDESLDAVEDQNLLARLFREYRADKVDEPLAEYSQRESSMSSDAERMYDNALASLNDLVGRYPELEAHRKPLEARLNYRYGKRLLRTGRGSEARKPLFEAIVGGFRDPRAIALFGVSLLPVGHRQTLWYLERAEEALV